MPDELVVKGASVSLTPVDATQAIVTMTHSLSILASVPVLKSASSDVFVEADVDASFATYTTQYTKPPYSTPGTLMYQSLKSIGGLSELSTKQGEPAVLKTTEGTITCSVVPATDPSSGNTDPAPSYDLDFAFTDAAQTLAKSD